VDEDRDGLRTTTRTRHGLLSLSEDKLIGVVNVRLKLREGFTLAHDTWDFDQLADIPIPVFPIFKSQAYILHVNHPL
jgi:hypothetical protein